MVNAILGFLCHLGEGLFGHISSSVSALVSAKVGVWERQLNLMSKKKFLLFARATKVGEDGEKRN